MEEELWKGLKFICFAKAIIWDLQKISAISPGAPIEEVEAILARRGFNLSVDALENVGGVLPELLPPYIDLPLYGEELDKLYPKE